MKLVGELIFENLEIVKIKLPSISFLHGGENKDSELAFIEVDIKGNRFELEIQSDITSELFEEANRYLELYKTKRDKILIVLIVRNQDEGTEREISVEIDWNEIEMKKVEDGEFGNPFKIDLKEINLEN